MQIESKELLERVACGMQSGESKGGVAGEEMQDLRGLSTRVATCADICPWASRDRVSPLNWQDVRGSSGGDGKRTERIPITQVASGRSGHLDPESELEDGLREPVLVVYTWTTQTVCGPGQKLITNQPQVYSTVADPHLPPGQRAVSAP